MGKKIKSLCAESGGCLFVQCGRLGQNETSAESTQAEIPGGKSEISWVPLSHGILRTEF